MEMVKSYAAEGKCDGNPTLGHSLDRVRLIPGLKGWFGAMPQEPVCLIQGYSTPGNADALRSFIAEMNGGAARIETVDLYDLPKLYEALGYATPDMHYHIADASHLEHLFKDGTVDLVVEDFLLNCLPAARHEALLREVSRVLRPGGLGIISFTSSEALKVSSAIGTTQFEADYHCAWNPEAYDIAELERAAGRELRHLVGKLVFNAPATEFVYMAAIGGRFEFFRSKDVMFSLFARCGLAVAAFDISEGLDDHGLTCVRYRCILKKETSAR